LGDDVVIFDPKIASKYLEIMSKIGVPINQSKSVISKSYPVVEFLKRLSINNVEVSALPWKDFMKQNNFKGRLNSLIGLFSKEETFKKNPIGLFNLVMKEKSFDNRPLRDYLGLLSLIFTYAKKAQFGIMEIVNLLASFGIFIDKGHIIFSKMDLSKLRKILVALIEEDKQKVISYMD